MNIRDKWVECKIEGAKSDNTYNFMYLNEIFYHEGLGVRISPATPTVNGKCKQEISARKCVVIIHMYQLHDAKHRTHLQDLLEQYLNFVFIENEQFCYYWADKSKNIMISCFNFCLEKLNQRALRNKPSCC